MTSRSASSEIGCHHRCNVFRDTGFRNLDLSVSKNWKFKERLTAQFRAEAFNLTNHPNFANPWGGTSGYGSGVTADPSVGPFGCGCATPDVAAVNRHAFLGQVRSLKADVFDDTLENGVQTAGTDVLRGAIHFEGNVRHNDNYFRTGY